MASRRPTHPRTTRSPGAQARGRRPGERARQPRVAGRPPRVATPPRGLSRRAAVMAVLLLVVATAMSPFVRALVAQQSRIAALEADVAERENRVSELDAELARWDDPAFVIAQARQRFTYVMPGEVGYVVLDDPAATDPAEDPTGAAAEEVSHASGSWFGALWTSVQVAGDAPGAEGADGSGGEPAGEKPEGPPATTPAPAPEVSGEP